MSKCSTCGQDQTRFVNGCHHDRDNLPTKIRNARIWIWENDGPIKITIKPGVPFTFRYYHETDEGYNAGGFTLEWDGNVLVQLGMNEPKRKTRTEALAALKTMEDFIGSMQRAVLIDNFRREERQYFYDLVCEYAQRIATMPKTYVKLTLVRLTAPDLAPWQVYEFEVFEHGECVQHGSYPYGDRFIVPFDVLDQLEYELIDKHQLETVEGPYGDADPGL